jgi:hypothetical protein
VLVSINGKKISNDGKIDSHHIVFTNNLHREEVCIYMPLLSCRKVENRIDITESREGKLWMN